MEGNPFESGARKAVPAVLVYARSGGRILMIHRNAGEARPGDYHAGKWNGLGGKCELDESPIEAARREFHEEAGVDFPVESFRPLGTLTFPNFKAHKNEDWIVFVFTIELPASEISRIRQRNDEGELHWVPVDDVTSLNLWAGDRHFMSYVVEGLPFMGTVWYRGKEVERHWVRSL